MALTVTPVRPSVGRIPVLLLETSADATSDRSPSLNELSKKRCAQARRWAVTEVRVSGDETRCQRLCRLHKLAVTGLRASLRPGAAHGPGRATCGAGPQWLARLACSSVPRCAPRAPRRHRWAPQREHDLPQMSRVTQEQPIAPTG